MPLINGDNGNNTLVDTAGDDTINGLDGDDTITVTNGNDSANGGNDNDTLVVNYGASSADISGGTSGFIYGDGVNRNVGFGQFERFVITTGGGNDTIGTALFDGNDVVNLGGGSDSVFTGSGDDDVLGGAGNDTIDVGTGDDTADGGTGDDRISANMTAATAAITWNLRTDFYSGPIGSFSDFEAFDVVSTGTGNDVIVSGLGAFHETINAGGGNDSVTVAGGNDSVNGGNGVDLLIVNYAAATGDVSGGFTSFVYAETGGARGVGFSEFERFIITTGSGNDTIGTEFHSGNDIFNLGDGNDFAFAAGGGDTLNGGGGNDELDGGTGADRMTGGPGDDIFKVDDGNDRAIEGGAGDGFDRVDSSVSFVLGAHIENLTLTGSLAVNGTGNILANTVTGNGAANVLNGVAGADTMIGQDGNDTYVVDNPGDQVQEASSFGGVDVVKSSVAFTLGDNLENLILLGSGDIDGTGNDGANVLTGNSGANRLDGGIGVDRMVGGGDDDVYVVDHAGDVVRETKSGDGTDRVESAISYTLGRYVENLVLTGSAADGTGNTLGNRIDGNDVANILKGGIGADQLFGGLGGDQLHGGEGNDILEGGADADGFRFDKALNAVSNVDEIADFSVLDDTIYLARGIFSQIAVGALSASAFQLGTTALDADDRILFDAPTGRIFYDRDGAGGTAAILFATVDVGVILTEADFVVYTV